MKYKTKYDHKLKHKYQKKLDDVAEYGEYYTSGDVWTTVNATYWNWSFPTKTSNRPVRNLYKEVMKLNKLCI